MFSEDELIPLSALQHLLFGERQCALIHIEQALMQRFADRPFSTWRNIELALQPYTQRLQGSRAGFLVNRKKELD
jgi:hypothetical protein